MAREIELLDDRGQARQRLSIWAGANMPHTIVTKELIDNEIDVVSERKQPATKTIIKLSKGRIKLEDNGTGISTGIKEGTGKTNLWLACAKMFTSSNYGGVSDSVGANGVGMTTANYTSHKFNVLNFNGRNVKGYQFTDGFLNGTEESGVKETGDLVNNPLTYEEANEKFQPFFEHGFLVDVTWADINDSNSVFEDEIDIDWLVRYAKLRTGEIAKGEVELYVYEDDEFEKELKHYIWNKEKDSENYLMSWEEKVKSEGGIIMKEGPWQIGFFTESKEIDSIVQGAPIKPRYSTSTNIDIQDLSIRIVLPITIKYFSEEYPPYSDQTKTDIRFPYAVISRLFEKSGDIYKHFYREAEKVYMSKVIKDSDSSMFWPSLGKPEDSELIIAEGYSAISGIKAQRNPNTQACIALRGKISNVFNMDMQKAMRSDIVKQILNAVLYNNYKRIIIAVDADPDGIGHICPLLVSLFYRFTNAIEDKKVYFVNTPYYIFSKKGEDDIKWSNNFRDCPKGWKTTAIKGLGSLDGSQIEKFIINEETRDLTMLVLDKDSEKSLDFAFSTGGKGWILTQKEAEIALSNCK